jgi:Tat protein translocase TatB subunit
MDIFGIGFAELIFIFLIALLIFGPRRLPEMAAKAGKFVRELRNMSQGFMTEWQREIAAAAQLEELEEARKELELTRQELQQARVNVASEVGSAKKDLNKSLTAASKAATSPETTKKTAPAAPAKKSEEPGETAPGDVEPAPQESPVVVAEPETQPDPPASSDSTELPVPENTISPFTGSPPTQVEEPPEDKGNSPTRPQSGGSARVETSPPGDNGRPASTDGTGAVSAQQGKMPASTSTQPSATSEPVTVRSDTLNE